MKTSRRSTTGFLNRLWNRPAVSRRQPRRRLVMEPLESRELLSVTLAPIAAQTVLAGAPLNLALNGTSSAGNPLDFAVEVSNAKLSAEIPEGNPSLRLDVAGSGIDGHMVLQLFEDLTPETVHQIVALAEGGFYDGLIFHRVIKGFMIQGGCPDGDGSGGPGFQFDDEFHPSLQFTSSGLLAMANSGPDTNGSQFFITSRPTRWLDFNHTIFGLLTEGNDVLQQINDVRTDSADRPREEVEITGATVFLDDRNGVLRLSAPLGTTGATQVTVTATDTLTGEWARQTFQVTIAPDTEMPPPFLANIEPIVTTAGTPVSFQIPVVNLRGGPLYFDAMVQPDHPDLTVSVNHATGEVTLTPTGSTGGVFGVLVGVSTSATSRYDTQMVPVYVGPAAPTAVELLPESDTGASDSDGVTNLNNLPSATLEFRVRGVLPGSEVELLADGVVIGRANAAGTSVVVTTDGTNVLADGPRQITARQTLKDQAVEVGNLETTTDLAGKLSAPLTIIVDTTPPQFISTPVAKAHEQSTYSYRVTTDEDSTGVVYELIEGPAGMVIDPATGLIAWTSVSEQGTVAPVIVRATDLAGNTALHEFAIEVLGPNHAPVLVPAGPKLGTVEATSPMTIALVGTFLNAGPGTTTITDADPGAVVGGIALVGTTGSGSWEYSLFDSTVFSPVGNVSQGSALLLPFYANLRYVPADAGDEIATITYRAWDTTGGLPGDRINTTTSGGRTAFSTAMDTAELSVIAAPRSSIAGFVYVDSNNNGQRFTDTGQPHLGIAGATIRLFRVTADETQLVDSTVTGPDGSYYFGDIPAGTYLIEQVQPANYLDGKDTLGTVGGETRGTIVGTDQLRVTLGSDEHGVEYNFGERGLKPGAMSLRLLLASSPLGATAPPAESAPAATAESLAAPAGVPATAGLLAITELNYNPYPPTPAEVAAGFDDAQSFEFIELQNVSDMPIDLTGVEFTAGIQFNFSAGAVTTLSPGEYVLVVQNLAAFQVRYGSELPVAGQYDGQLDDAGEQLTLRDRSGGVIHDFWYRQSGAWPEAAHGQGSSLEPTDLTGNYDDVANWRASTEYGGSPGHAGIGLLDLVFGQDEDLLDW